jgi:hypothetical protein
MPGILTAMADSREPIEAAAERAVSYLEEISPEMRGCAILDAEGAVLSTTGEPDAWGRAGGELLAAADAAAGEPASHAHIATGDGEAFMVREGGLAAVAVAERFTLASLMLFDLRVALRDLAADAAAA